MRAYAARHVFSAEEKRYLARAMRLVDLAPTCDEHGREVRCHELARAVGQVLRLPVVDGVVQHILEVQHS